MNKAPLHILLVGDTPTDAELIQKNLAPEWGVKWARVEQLNEAIALLRENSFDVALLNLSLPDAPGWEAIKDLRTAIPDIGIVVVAEPDDAATAVQCIRAGAQEYLAKTEINRNSLARSLGCAIERMRQQSGRGICHPQTGEVEENMAVARESQQQLQAILDYAPAVIYIKDLAGRYLLVNRQYENLFHIDTEAIKGKTDFDLFPKESADEFRANDVAVAAANSAMQWEEFVPQDDGFHAYITSKFPLRDAAGVPYAVGGISIDITALKKAETERDRFFDIPLDMLCIAGFDGYFKRLNPTWELALGYSQEELFSNPFINFVHPEDRESTLAEVQKLSTGALTVYFENRYRCKDGSYKWLAWMGAPFTQEGLIYAVARNISDRKAAEQEKTHLIESLQESEARHRALLDAIPDIMFHCSADGTYLDFKPAEGMETLVPASSLVGKKATDVLPPDLAEKIMQAQARALSAEESQILEYDLPLDGDLHHYEARIAAIRGRDEVIAIVRDITERKQTDEALLVASERLQLAIEGSALGTWDWNVGTGETYFSPQWKAMLGYEVQEVENNYPSWERLIHPEDLPQVLDALGAYLQGRSSLYAIEFRMKNKFGEWQWILAQGKIFKRDESGAPLRMTGTHKDITARKMAEEALQQQLKRERLVGTMQERIRSSLNLHEVLTTAVEEVRQFLQVERTIIYRFKPDWSGEVIVESVDRAWHSLARMELQDNCFVETSVPLYQKGRICAIADIYESELNPCYVNFLRRLQVRAKLVLPILQGENLWGLLIVHHCSGSRQWQEYEIASLEQLGVQLAIAIQQCTLFEQARIEIAERRLAEEALRLSEARERDKATQLEATLRKLGSTQAQLVQNEKMVSLGQLVAGIAHEINNPVSFIYGNVTYANQYADELLNLVQLYQKYYPEPALEIQETIEEIDLNFLKLDFINLLKSMKNGANRIREIVLSLRNFSRLDEAAMKAVNIHEGIDSTLLILQNRLKDAGDRSEIKVVKEYGNLPLVECYAGQLNQVFVNLIANAIDALEEKSVECGVRSVELKERGELESAIEECQENSSTPHSTLNTQHSTLHTPHSPTIRIRTQLIQGNKVSISIADNGPGIPEEIQPRLFDPFFTTKPIGAGTGLGLSISYQLVVEKHGGQLTCFSAPGKGAEFVIELPVQQKSSMGNRE